MSDRGKVTARGRGRGKFLQPPRQTDVENAAADGGQQEKPRTKRANDVGNDLIAREKRTRSAAAAGAEEVQVDVAVTASDPENSGDELYAPSGDSSGASTESDSSPWSSPDRQASARQQHQQQALTGANTGTIADVSQEAPQQLQFGLHTVPPPQMATPSAAEFQRMLVDLLVQGTPGSTKRDEIWLARVRGCTVLLVRAPPPPPSRAVNAPTHLPILCSAYPVASCYTHQ
jgi:hypothetical protein